MAAITLAADGTTLTLNPDLYWSDEQGWFPVEQTSVRTITGSLVVSTALKTGGRPITLTTDSEDSGWVTRADVEQLRNWASVPGKVLTLTLRGTSRSVIFRHQDVAFDAAPVAHYSDINSADFYRATIRFQEA